MIYRLETQSGMKSNTYLPHLYSYPTAVFLLNTCWVVLHVFSVPLVQNTSRSMATEAIEFVKNSISEIRYLIIILIIGPWVVCFALFLFRCWLVIQVKRGNKNMIFRIINNPFFLQPCQTNRVETLVKRLEEAVEGFKLIVVSMSIVLFLTLLVYFKAAITPPLYLLRYMLERAILPLFIPGFLMCLIFFNIYCILLRYVKAQNDCKMEHP